MLKNVHSSMYCNKKILTQPNYSMRGKHRTDRIIHNLKNYTAVENHVKNLEQTKAYGIKNK